MNYFPPPNAKANWTHGDRRTALYKHWYMSVTHASKGFMAMIWQHFQNKCISKKKSGFKTEELAVKWCEHNVEMKIVNESLTPQYAGAGI